jgi:hypothetical protein
MTSALRFPYKSVAVKMTCSSSLVENWMQSKMRALALAVTSFVP